MALRRFGVFELDEEAGELRRQGRLVHLTGQPFKTLQLLASRPGEIVTRAELRAHIWGDARFVEFDRGLNFCIATVRTALRDSARSPRFIETVPRRGYRFIADVRTDQIPRAQDLTPTAHSALRTAAVLAVVPLLLAQGATTMRGHTRVTADPSALAAFETGLAQAGDGMSGRRRSIYSFRQAVRLDPRFAEAHYALADVYLDLAGARELPASAALREARDAAVEALALEEVPSTRRILGTVRLLHDWDWHGAGSDLARSLAAEPNSDAALTSYARYLSAAGDAARAIELIDRAESISPSCDLLLWESAVIRYRARRWQEALDKAALALEYGPPGGVEPKAWAQQIAWLRVLIRVEQQDWTAASAEIAAIGGRAVATEESVRRFLGNAADFTARTAAAKQTWWIATLYALSGNNTSALTWLERAIAERDPDVLYALRNPAFDGLRTHDRFRRILTLTGHADLSTRRLS